MFDDIKPNVRKWQCFVCGRNYENYDAYKQHIVDDHEEGREYLCCPACDAPVRDLKVHYKTKHPAREMPKNLQTRVIVWKDVKTGKDGKGKTVTRRPNSRKGTFTSRKNGKDFEYKSGLECDFFECVEADKDIEAYDYEGLKIPYFYRGEWHNYIPDLRVRFIDGATQIWEIKPANQTHLEQNKAKWAAANNYCHNVGFEFVVLTEVGLEKLKGKIRRQHQTSDGGSLD